MSYGEYGAVFHASRKVSMRIDDAVFDSANDDNDCVSQNAIIMLFKREYMKAFGKKPTQYVAWDDTHFDIKRIGDAEPLSYKRAPRRPKPTKKPREEVSCTCPDSCFMCDIGDHHRCHRCPRTR